MIEIITEKDKIDNFHYVITWKAIPKSKMMFPKPNHIHYFDNDKIPTDFFKKYDYYFVDGGFLRYSILKEEQER